MKILVVCHSITSNYAQSNMVRNLLATDAFKNEEIFFLQEKLGKQHEDNCYNYSFEIEDFSISSYKKSHNVFMTLIFLINKILYKICPASIKLFIKQKYLSRVMEKICIENNINTILALSDFEDVRGGALTMINGFNKALFFTEIPLNNRFSNNPTINKKRLDKWYKKINYFFVRGKDLRFFSPYGDKVIKCEFPLLVRHLDFNSNNSKTLLYFGAFHKIIREPYILFNLMRNYLSDWTLYIYGSSAKDYENVPSNVFFRKSIDLEKNEELISKAYGFVNISNTKTPISGCKEIMYFSYNKPIINFFGDSYDEHLGQQYGMYINVRNETELEKVLPWLTEKKVSLLNHNWDATFNKFSPDFVAKVIIDTFKR